MKKLLFTIIVICLLSSCKKEAPTRLSREAIISLWAGDYKLQQLTTGPREIFIAPTKTDSFLIVTFYWEDSVSNYISKLSNLPVNAPVSIGSYSAISIQTDADVTYSFYLSSDNNWATASTLTVYADPKNAPINSALTFLMFTGVKQ